MIVFGVHGDESLYAVAGTLQPSDEEPLLPEYLQRLTPDTWVAGRRITARIGDVGTRVYYFRAADLRAVHEK